MSLDTIPTRADLQTIDRTWFNVLQAVLGVDFVPRNSSGAPTDIAGGLGTLAYAWGAAYVQSLLLRSNGNTAGLVAPSGLSASYNLTLPSGLPSSVAKMTVDTSGNISYAGSNVTTTSGNSGSFSWSTNSFTQVTNLSESFVCTGRPVLMTLGGPSCEIYVQNTSGPTSLFACALYRNGVAIQEATFGSVCTTLSSPILVTSTHPCGAFTFLDTSPPPGTNTYAFYVAQAGGGTLNVFNTYMTLVEL